MTAQVTLLTPRRGWGLLPDVHELWRFREAFAALVRRDLKVRYRQTVLGAAWALIQPAAVMGVFSVFLGRLAHVPSDGIPYPLFAACGLSLWMYVAGAVSAGAMSLVEQRALLTKVYLPRLLLPMTPLTTLLFDLGIALLLPAGLLACYGIAPAPALLLLPAFLLLAIVTALGATLWLSALNARYRDVRYAVPFLMQIWLFATPVAYPASLAPERWHPLLGLNPMACAVEGFRWSLAGGPPPAGLAIPSAVMAMLLLATGLAYFQRVERTLADVV